MRSVWKLTSRIMGYAFLSFLGAVLIAILISIFTKSWADYSPIMKAEVDCKQCENATTAMKALQEHYTVLVDDKMMDYQVAAMIECELLGDWLDVGWWIVENCPDVYDRWMSAIRAAKNCRAVNYSSPEEFLRKMDHQRKAACAVADSLMKYRLIWIHKWPGLGA